MGVRRATSNPLGVRGGSIRCTGEIPVGSSCVGPGGPTGGRAVELVCH